MTQALLTYPLSSGYIHHWLVCGPISPNLDEIPLFSDLDYHKVIDSAPVDTCPVGAISGEIAGFNWRYHRCLDDHLVTFNALQNIQTASFAWAFVEIEVQAALAVNVSVSSACPVVMWVNQDPAIVTNQQAQGKIITTSHVVNLLPGRNSVMARLELHSGMSGAMWMALQVNNLGSNEAQLVLAEKFDENKLQHRMDMEKVIYAAQLDRYVYGNFFGDRFDRNEAIRLSFSNSLDTRDEITMRLQSRKGDIFQEMTNPAAAGAEFLLAEKFPLRSGPHLLTYQPNADDTFIKKIKLERSDLFYIVRNATSEKSYGTRRERALEALNDAAKRRTDSLYCEIAKMALSQWEKIHWEYVEAALARVVTELEDSAIDLLGFLGWMGRYWRKKTILAALKNKITAAIIGYSYQAESDSPVNLFRADTQFTAESRQFLTGVCELLAGQQYSQQEFTQSGKTGAWHQVHGESVVMEWMADCGKYGLRQWDSAGGIEAALAGLSHLVDLAQSPEVREMATTLMDKIFFLLGVNSFKGSLSACHSESDLGSLVSGRLSPVAGIQRLMWGMGNFNDHDMGVVSLACCKNYALPDVIRKVATQISGATWGRERMRSTNTAAGVEVYKAIYKTADFFLSSLQDYGPGKPGEQEQVWQVTMGADARVFTNHPRILSVNAGLQPNLWQGHGSLPRIAQWGDVLVAIYQLPQDDWLGFTHAFFPSTAFDEYEVHDFIAFARKGNAYLSLRALKPFEWITQGHTAYRELRSRGHENIWVCQMGQALIDKSYEAFKEKIQQQEINLQPLHARIKSIRGDVLEFGWEGELLVNGKEQTLEDPHHILNQYGLAEFPADALDIVYKDRGVRLKFA